MKPRVLAVLEILSVYAVMQVSGILLHSTGTVQWERQYLGWSYTGMLLFIGLPFLVIWLTGRNWVEYGVSLNNWRTNLDLGIKAYLVRFIPIVLGLGGAALLRLDTHEMSGGAFVALMEFIGLAVMIWVMDRQKPIESGQGNLIVTFLLLLFPILLAVVLHKLSALIISTIFWQFVFSGFGEEFVWRGYVQSRLNQAFGRPICFWGIQFGLGLIVASLLFGLLHAFNTYEPTIGLDSLSWGWALSSCVAGLLFGIIREKTGTLLAPGIAHGLPDAVGEAFGRLMGWM